MCPCVQKQRRPRGLGARSSGYYGSEPRVEGCIVFGLGFGVGVLGLGFGVRALGLGFGLRALGLGAGLRALGLGAAV